MRHIITYQGLASHCFVCLDAPEAPAQHEGFRVTLRAGGHLYKSIASCASEVVTMKIQLEQA